MAQSRSNGTAKASKLAANRPTPPDGGWGWFIVFATFLTTTISAGSLFSFSVFFVAYLEAFNGTKANTAWIGSIAIFTFTMFGPISLAIARTFGHRTSLMVGGVISALGHILSSFTTNLYQLYFTYGIMMGVGFGITHLSAIEMVGIYFKKKLPIAMGFALAGGGLGQFVMCIVSQALIDIYGWRGLHIILSAVALHICVAGALFRPLEGKTYSKVPDEEREKGTRGENDVNQDHCNNHKGERRHSITSQLSKHGNSGSKYTEVLNDDAEVTSINAHQGCTACDCLKSFLKALYDWSLLKEPVFLVLLLTIVLQAFGTNTITIHLVRRARDVGLSATESSFLPAVLGLGQLFGRPLIGSIGNLPRMKPYILYGICYGGCGLCVLLSIFISSYAALISIMVVFGACMGGYMVLLSVNIAYFLGGPRLGYAMSITMQVGGITSLMVGPITGFMRDHYGVYDQAFILATCAYAVAVPLTTIAMPIADKVVRRRRSKEAAEGSKVANGTEISFTDKQGEGGEFAEGTSSV